MDPDANLKEQREIAAALLAADDRRHPDTGTLQSADVADYEHNGSRLAELVQALDEWISNRGFLPAAWKHRPGPTRTDTTGATRPVRRIHLAMYDLPDKQTVYNGRAVCHAGTSHRTEKEQFVSADIQDVTCENCKRIYTKRQRAPQIRQTSCKHCGQDVEGWTDTPNEWRDRGNNTHCQGDAGQKHEASHD